MFKNIFFGKVVLLELNNDLKIIWNKINPWPQSCTEVHTNQKTRSWSFYREGLKRFINSQASEIKTISKVHSIFILEVHHRGIEHCRFQAALQPSGLSIDDRDKCYDVVES